MTDLWELTGPQPSDPCGVEGTPPNLSELEVSTEVKWEWTKVGLGPLALPVYLPSSCQMNVTVRARDNVGVQWVRFHIEGRGEVTVRLPRGSNNTTATAWFDHDLLGAIFFGYDLNITVCDVNGNEGYLEKHINSLLEDFVAWVLGKVTALAEFVMELASAAIEWIWEAVSRLVDRVFSPVKESAMNYINKLNRALLSAYSEKVENGSCSDETKEVFSKSLVNHFILSIFTIVIVFKLIIKIINYFIQWFSWVLMAILLLIVGVILIYIGMTIAESDIDTSYSINDFIMNPFSIIFKNKDNIINESRYYKGEYPFWIFLIDIFSLLLNGFNVHGLIGLNAGSAGKKIFSEDEFAWAAVAFAISVSISLYIVGPIEITYGIGNPFLCLVFTGIIGAGWSLVGAYSAGKYISQLSKQPTKVVSDKWYLFSFVLLGASIITLLSTLLSCKKYYDEL